MKAVFCEQYGPPELLTIKEVPTPTPVANEVLVRVHASSVNFYNTAHVKGAPLLSRLWSGFKAPKHRIPGGDFSGVVTAVGSEVPEFEVGDKVFGDLSPTGFGAYAEYASVPAANILKIPESITFQQAAALPEAGVVALQGLRDKGNLAAGQHVLIVGASGGIGTYAVQIAKILGAEVTAVCGGESEELVRKLGADHVVDYRKTPVRTIGQTFDLILPIAGDLSMSDFSRLLTPRGTLVVVGGAAKQYMPVMLLGPLRSRKGGKRFTNLYANPNRSDLETLNNWQKEGKLTSVVDSEFTLEECAAAMRHYSDGHPRGKVIITIPHSTDI